ncbi:DUF4225 domain-containing protein [Xenorhabdus cabanillasii]|uniref:Uncharacterized protein n=1 Tax=Xenorhabdus cabanillasii JM26 TaxID=1427517 RepID=W1IRJ8_9GAMM|nr:DUF4225 domain-containing protein [Xenorhabdus cabanillasii]PHM75426.1 hypothetical protein Xcab_04090 [Xenorhabdus cabanillasii JM26]CDL80438.1 conserved hypothetical protein [Xenorhabdus cabanillasii JM26]
MANILQERFDYAANELMKVARYSSAYLLEDIEFKNGYLREINEVIRLIRNDLKIALYHYGKKRFENWKVAKKYVKEIEMELEAEKYGYEQLRKKDRKSYLKTQEFSEKGVVFYAKNGLTIVGGVVQTVFGVVTFVRGKILKPFESKTMGTLGFVTGLGDTAEGVTNILYEITDGEINSMNPTKILTKKGFSALGIDEEYGEITYDVVDFCVSVYFGFAVLTKFDHPKRIIHLPLEAKGGLQKVPFLDKLFTNKGVRLFKWAAADFKRKVFVSSKPVITYKATNSSIKMYLLIDKYINQNDENN